LHYRFTRLLGKSPGGRRGDSFEVERSGVRKKGIVQSCAKLAREGMDYLKILTVLHCRNTHGGSYGAWGQSRETRLLKSGCMDHPLCGNQRVILDQKLKRRRVQGELAYDLGNEVRATVFPEQIFWAWVWRSDFRKNNFIANRLTTTLFLRLRIDYDD